MGNYYTDPILAAQRREELLSEAARARMVKAARAGQVSAIRRLAASLRSWLGRQLVAWGLRLQGCPEAVSSRAI